MFQIKCFWLSIILVLYVTDENPNDKGFRYVNKTTFGNRLVFILVFELSLFHEMEVF